jgi:glycosyltransferase involved in cell wall biosynthesis
MEDYMNELISVIVPVYNVEPYLDRCIGSIVNQTYKNLEIILVDDGSTDDSGKICDQWKEKDSRIKVIHKKNGGLSDARNTGMKQMTGKYVAFVDSDDWIEVSMYERMIKMIKKSHADICECGFQRKSSEKEKTIQATEQKKIIMDKKAALEAVVTQKIEPVVWNKLYKRVKIENIMFQVGKYNEDEFWTYLAVDKIQKMIQIPDVLYNYFQRADSIINTSYSLKRLDGLQGRYERMQYLKQYPDIYHIAKRNMYFECMFHYQMGLMYLTGQEFEKSKKTIKNYKKKIHISFKDFLKYDWKEKIFFCMSKISFQGVCVLRNKMGYGI